MFRGGEAEVDKIEDLDRERFNLRARKVAFLFAGQGAKAGAVRTEEAQIEVFEKGLFDADSLVAQGIVPNVVAGFSAGEVPALTFAGMMSRKQGRDFIEVRAKAMQRCCDKYPGGMVAVLRLDATQISQKFKNVWAVNFNAPDQTVYACAESEIEKFSEEVRKAGGRAVKIGVSGAFHSPFMNDASENVADYIREEFKKEKVKASAMPVYSNFTAGIYDEESFAELITKQVNHPVLWMKIIEKMIEDGVDTFYEVGPGRVLSGLVRRINLNVTCYSTEKEA